MGQSKSRFYMDPKLFSKRELRNITVEGFADFLCKKENILVLHMAEGIVDEPCPLLISEATESVAEQCTCSCRGLYCKARGWSTQWLTYSPGVWLAFVDYLRCNGQLLRCYTESLFSLEAQLPTDQHLIHVFGSTSNSSCTSCLRSFTWEWCHSHLLRIMEKHEGASDDRSISNIFFKLDCNVCGGLIEPIHYDTSDLVNNHVSYLIRQDILQADALIILGNGSLSRYPLQGIPLDLPAHVPRMLIHPTPLLVAASDVRGANVGGMGSLVDSHVSAEVGCGSGEGATTSMEDGEFWNPADGFSKEEGTILVARLSRPVLAGIEEDLSDEAAARKDSAEFREPENELWEIVRGSKGLVHEEHGNGTDTTSNEEDDGDQDAVGKRGKTAFLFVLHVFVTICMSLKFSFIWPRFLFAGSAGTSDITTLWHRYNEVHGDSDIMFPTLTNDALSWGFRHQASDNYRDVVLLSNEIEGITRLYSYFCNEEPLEGLHDRLVERLEQLRHQTTAVPDVASLSVNGEGSQYKVVQEFQHSNEQNSFAKVSPVREKTTTFFAKFSPHVISSKIYLQELPEVPPVPAELEELSEAELSSEKQGYIALLEATNNDILKNAFVAQESDSRFFN